nr:terminase gpA endonuclease subunit [Pseudotabrizicola alkalilacus]
MHFPRRLDADYFRQLTAERVVTRFEKGRPIRSWQPKRDGERNEALDTFVYAHAALHGLISMGMRLNEEAEGRGGAGIATFRRGAGSDQVGVDEVNNGSEIAAIANLRR